MGIGQCMKHVAAPDQAAFSTKLTARRESTLPASAIPVDVYFSYVHLNHVILGSYSTHSMPTERAGQQQPDNLQAALPQQDDPRHWAVEEVQQKRRYEDDGQNVAAAIRNGTCRAVTDGSYKNSHGTAGFYIHGDDPNKQLEGSNRTPGHPDDQPAYRSELRGVVGALTLLQTMCSYHDITEGKVELGLDRESAIHKIEDGNPPKVHNPSYDMIMEARQMINQLPIEVKLRWTEGHLDSKGKRKDWWARQNIRMDQRAKRYWRQHSRNPRPNHPLALERISISIKGQKLTHLDKEQAHELLLSEPIKAYWPKKDKVEPTEWPHINWKASKKVLKEQPRGMRRWFAKFATRHIGVACMMKIRKHWDHSKCPRCGHNEETTEHVVQCATEATQEVWINGIAKLEKWMTLLDTEPELQKHILFNLNQWRKGVNHRLLCTHNQWLLKVLQRQNSMGWHNFLLGRHAKEFEHVQTSHYQAKGSHKTGFHWTVALIKKLMGIVWNIWDRCNSVLHNDEVNFHTKLLTEAADRQIRQEFTKGKSNLLPADKWMFRSKRHTLNLPLGEKQRWLETATGAKAAWADQQQQRPNYDQERQSL